MPDRVVGAGKDMVNSMNVRNCRRCSRLFNYVNGPLLCQACREEMEQKFQEVKEFIRANPGVMMQQVSEACDVPTSQIQQWLREERLEVTENSAIRLSCEACGASIRSGRYCEKCKYDMTMGFRRAMTPDKVQLDSTPKRADKDNPKMRFL